jgi:16S rRNA (cytidine1402-2'-O)-methyltransferase
MLYLVATPIGNLGDITSRAVNVLRSVDVIAAEDTRVTRKLLSHLGIRTPLVSYHEHSGPAATGALVRRMAAQGQSVALVTDAGTPGISDPGADLVAEAISSGVTVTPIPGPTACIAALTASGLPTARFVFEGFLPRTRSTRIKKLNQLKHEERTVIFYESPQRIGATIGEISAVFGCDRAACVGRELTKLFEEFRRGTLGGLAEHFESEKTRGECVLVVSGATPEETRRIQNAAIAAINTECDAAEPLPRGRDLIRLLAEEIGVPRRDLYQMVLDLKKAR